MTDREMAEEYLTEYKPPEMVFLNGRKCYSKKQTRQAFITRFEAGQDKAMGKEVEE